MSDDMPKGLPAKMAVTKKAMTLATAWDAIDAGQPLNDDQQREVENWNLLQSYEGRTEAESDLDKTGLRTAVRIAKNQDGTTT